MAILIVDDEDNTRFVLQEFLKQLELGPVLEARNGDEARAVIETEKGALRMIISDWEMPLTDGLALLEYVSNDPDLDLTPFVLITSDPGVPRPARLDACLPKPFQISALSRALAEGQAHRRQSRDLLLYFGGRQVTGFKEAMQSGHGTHWKDIAEASDFRRLEALIEKHQRKLGALLIEAESCDGATAAWLDRFRGTSAGRAIYAVCLSKTPDAGLSLRRSCDFFLNGRVSFQRWHSLIESMARKIRQSWELEHRSTQCLLSLKSGNQKAALKTARKILEIDPGNEKALEWLALILASTGERTQAIDRLREILESNPYCSGAYLQLMELMRKETPLARQAIARKAAKLCPDDVRVLVASARILGETGAAAELPPLLEKIFLLDPGNSEAMKLRAS